LALLIFAASSFYVVAPSERGVRVTLGTMSEQFVAPGLGAKLPLVIDIYRVNVQQDTREVSAECFRPTCSRSTSN
jgi:regulator of protease activity HflC (stomatin/prohibitin superfamily)